ncbi:hypothetical protein SAMN04488128_103206 [Chitinophaga eiseniae]|uniref:Uncharacterized protein n=2 Tax=Chitinophaga eiseniae TaxID=634771 RepID=A0A1T4SQ65_9BACT|nr:hypothetical protein SAMN04488128_103206 [Chitinophaga eiseniae]
MNLTEHLQELPVQVAIIIAIALLYALLRPKENIDGEDRYKDRTSFRKLGRGDS